MPVPSSATPAPCTSCWPRPSRWVRWGYRPNTYQYPHTCTSAGYGTQSEGVGQGLRTLPDPAIKLPPTSVYRLLSHAPGRIPSGLACPLHIVVPSEVYSYVLTFLADSQINHPPCLFSFAADSGPGASERVPPPRQQAALFRTAAPPTGSRQPYHASRPQVPPAGA